jgi:hypothetical protein
MQGGQTHYFLQWQPYTPSLTSGKKKTWTLVRQSGSPNEFGRSARRKVIGAGKLILFSLDDLQSNLMAHNTLLRRGRLAEDVVNIAAAHQEFGHFAFVKVS